MTESASVSGRASSAFALHPIYVLAAIGLFVIEVLIALFVKDGFVRPYLGDVLAVMLVYTALRAVSVIDVSVATVVSLLIALMVELSQLFGVLELVGLETNTLARVVLGSSFEWLDLVAYLAGAVVVVAIESLRPT